jgi:hypothetical protein
MLISGGFREHNEGCPAEPILRRMMGCDEVAPRVVFRLGEVEHRRCPYFYLEGVWEFLSYYGQYRQGFLPEAGGIADQAGTFVAACSVLGGELARIAKKREGDGEREET